MVRTFLKILFHGEFSGFCFFQWWPMLCSQASRFSWAWDYRNMPLGISIAAGGGNTTFMQISLRGGQILLSWVSVLCCPRNPRHAPEEHILAWRLMKCLDSWIIIWWMAHMRTNLSFCWFILEGKPGDGFSFQFW
jgi:hypothetical protein